MTSNDANKEGDHGRVSLPLSAVALVSALGLDAIPALTPT